MDERAVRPEAPTTAAPLRVRDATSSAVRSVGVDAALQVPDAGNGVAEAIEALARHHVLRTAHERLFEYSLELERLLAERTAEVAAVERRRDDLVDLTAHDIKNSLGVFDAALEMIAEDPLEAPGMLPLLRRATGRIARLVGTLLEVNRLESGSVPVRVTEVPWATLCETMLAEVGFAAQAKSIALNRSGESHVIVRCDPHLIERVLLNLLDNAIAAAPQGSVVDIHSESRPDGGLRVLVGNRGPVIAADVLPTLFQKYARKGEPSVLKRFGGWGLGLVFCRLAIERHGGWIRPISPYVDGEGTAFEFEVPGVQG